MEWALADGRRAVDAARELLGQGRGRDSEGAEEPSKRLTLGVVRVTKREEVLLGRKKRGFGAGKWNGFGGKAEAGESPLECMQREMLEETGARMDDPKRVAVFLYVYGGELGVFEVHVFVAEGLEANAPPRETDEMAPAWFPLARVPFDDMWPDVRLWWPLVFGGADDGAKEHRELLGVFFFSPDLATVTRFATLKV